MKKRVSKAIAVEGRDDVAAVSRAVEALLIPTHGFGITAETWRVLDKAYDEKGLIILTDPDFSGEEIRRRLTERYPDATQAYIPQEDAVRDGDIGVENASPEVILEAIGKAIALEETAEETDYEPVTQADLVRLGLAGCEDASENRARLCAELGIGYGNAGALLKKLAHWKIGRKELERKIK